MEGVSRFSYGGMPSRVDQYVMTTPVHSTLAQPRVPQQQAMPAATGGTTANPLDLRSAIAHELQRSNSAQPLLQCYSQWGTGTSTTHTSSSYEADIGLQAQVPYSHQGAQQDLIPQYIPRFDENHLPGPAAAMHQHHQHQLQQLPTRFEYSYTTTTPESESFASARQEFYSGSAGNGMSTSLHPSSHQDVMGTARVDSMRSYSSPWIERMLQSDVTPTPCPSGRSPGISTSLSLAQRSAAARLEASCVASQTVDLQSCHSNDMQQRSEKSMRSAFSCDPPHVESTVELFADLGSDDEDVETRPMDVKRKKRMLSNRASAQRSRQRRQERLDHLEVLTAQLRVANSTLQKKLTAAVQEAKKFEDQNKSLLKKVDRLSKELEGEKQKVRKPSIGGALDECASSQQTTCASSCEMAGGRLSVDPNVMRDDNVTNDGVSTPSLSPRSSGWPSENYIEGELSNGNNITAAAQGAMISPVRKSLSACKMGSKKRSHDQSTESATAFGASCESMSLGNHMGSGSLGLMGVTSSQLNACRPTRPPTGLPTSHHHVLDQPLTSRPLGHSALGSSYTPLDLETDWGIEFHDWYVSS